MTIAARLHRTGLVIGLVAAVGCSALQPAGQGRGTAQPDAGRRGSPFLARQYLDGGRRAWAAGNEANARFLVGRAVELDPGSEAALAFWEEHWPLDSLPAAADSARRALVAGPAGRAGAEEHGASAEGRALPDESSAAGAPDRAGVGSAADVAQIRAQFERARSAGDRAGIERGGQNLLRAAPQHLPSLHRVLSTWVDHRVDPAATEARVRDVLGSLEFGDPNYLVGKPDDVTDSAYLRSYRGRFLDLLGWSAFQRGDLAQAEAALRSAESEINLRGRGDVSHLRHLAAFYERRRSYAKAERYAIAAAARDESALGEIRALAARLWTRNHGSSAGLESRLASEAERVRKEERSAAIAGRLYAPLPIFSAARGNGTLLTDRALRGQVHVLVLWEPGCEDCLRLLRDLAAGALTPTGAGKAQTIALAVGGEAAVARAALGGLSGIVAAMPEKPGGLVLALGAERLPLTLVVEPAGFIQYRHVGYPRDPEGRERWLERLRWQVASLVSLR